MSCIELPTIHRDITKLKIDSNPFAKGFRDSSRLTDFDRDPMDAMFMDQHFLRAPMRLLSELDAENNNASLFSASLMEKARTQLQMWGRAQAGAVPGGGAPYTPAELHALLLSGTPQLYGRMPLPLPHLWASAAGAVGAAGASGGVPGWQGGMPGLPAGLLGPPPPPHGPPPGAPPPPPQRPQVSPPPTTTTTSACSSPSPSGGAPPPLELRDLRDLRLPRPIFPGMSPMQQRFPYGQHPGAPAPKPLSPPAVSDPRT
ncbi:T-box protein H15 [Frankliniella fusca]|uniref:T-box protein H15 n=1 Tax=Frankliniella fusca TaxID=407009 RepID=A0AAE1HJM4_9NEOP|nr:T-box protein H15 [Frankliniella fusca]